MTSSAEAVTQKPETLPPALSSMWRLCRLGFRHEARLMAAAFVLSQLAAIPDALLEPVATDLDRASRDVGARTECRLVGGRQVCPAASAGDSLEVGIVDVLVTAVMMQVAGQPDVDGRPTRRDQHLFEEREVALPDRILDVAVDPVRLRGREDHAISPLQLLGDLCEALCVPFGIDPPLHRRRVDFWTKNRSFSIEKARRRLGYAPRVDVEEGIALTAAAYRQAGWL